MSPKEKKIARTWTTRVLAKNPSGGNPIKTLLSVLGHLKAIAGDRRQLC